MDDMGGLYCSLYINGKDGYKQCVAIPSMWLYDLGRDRLKYHFVKHIISNMGASVNWGPRAKDLCNVGKKNLGHWFLKCDLRVIFVNMMHFFALQLH